MKTREILNRMEHLSMNEVNGDLYVIEPNHGELDRITPQGKISRVVDISASQGHIVSDLSDLS